jgi:hypothetical protein
MRLARFDPNAISEFDASYGGFFRSFGAMLVCLPMYAVILLGERQMEIAGAVLTKRAAVSIFAFYATEGISYIVDWLSFPLAMLAISPLIGTNQRYVPFIVAYNWGTCLVFALLAAPYLLYLAGMPLGAFLFLYYVGTIFALIYRWRIARDGLAVSGLTATGVVILDVLLGVLLTVIAAKFRAASI